MPEPQGETAMHPWRDSLLIKDSEQEEPHSQMFGRGLDVPFVYFGLLKLGSG
jgi:hypothetical protein